MGTRVSRRPVAIAGTLALAIPALAQAGPANAPPPPPAPDDAGTAPRPGTAAPEGSRRSADPPPPGSIPPAPTPPPSSSPPPTSEPVEPPVDLSRTWGYSKSRPLTPRYTRRADEPGYVPPNPSGFYSGVSVGGNHVPPVPPERFDSTPRVMTWVGFERTDAGSRIFFQLNGPVEHTIDKSGLVIRLRLVNTKVNVKNNMRRLDMQYFATPVREVRITKKGKDMIATIHLRRDATPNVQLVDGKAGFKLLTLQFE